jgi:radical SAM superfamily enzyme YgiQ (UPF0313 family)
MKADPWDYLSTGEWFKPEVIEYFRPQINEIINGLIEARPKIIGLSLHSTNRTIAREVVKAVRAGLPEAVIVVGGYDCVYHYSGPRLFPDHDYMVIGEAELTLGPLVKALLAGQRPKDLPGIVSRYDSPGRTWTPAPLLQDLDSIDFPRYDWIDMKLYRDYNAYRLTPIVTTRGCRWARCRFCNECFAWRKRDALKVVDEMQWLVERGSRDFHFNVSDMNSDPDTLVEICKEIVRRKLAVTLLGQLRIHKKGTREFFDHLRAAGGFKLQFGVDGWSKNTLRLQRKGYSMRIIEENLRNCHDAGISAAVNMVVGVPGETEEDIKESIQNILRNKRNIYRLESVNTLILAPGSDYYKEPERHNIRFRGDKQAIYDKYPQAIPAELWYSTDPYIDHEVRAKRLETIRNALDQEGVEIGPFAQTLIKRILDNPKSYGLDFLEAS